MSPLRRWMHEHGHPTWWAWVVVVVVPMLVAALGMMVSLSVNARSIERERLAREESQRAFCAIVVLLDDSYRRNPPSTPAGRELARAIAQARNANRCDAANRTLPSPSKTAD